MRPVSALSTSVETLRDHPVIIGVLFAFSLVSTGLSAVQIVNPLAGSLSVGLVYLGLPFLMGGLLAMVAEAPVGDPSVDTFLVAGKRHYVGLLVGSLLVAAATVVLYLVVVAVFAVAAVAVFSVGGGGLGAGTIALLAVAGLLAYLFLMIPLFLTQFFPVGIVLDDDGIADAFRRSLRLVRTELRSVLGFDLLALAISLVAQIPVAVLVYRAFDVLADRPPSELETFTLFDALSTTEMASFSASSW